MIRSPEAQPEEPGVPDTPPDLSLDGLDLTSDLDLTEDDRTEILDLLAPERSFASLRDAESHVSRSFQLPDKTKSFTDFAELLDEKVVPNNHQAHGLDEQSDVGHCTSVSTSTLSLDEIKKRDRESLSPGQGSAIGPRRPYLGLAEYPLQLRSLRSRRNAPLEVAERSKQGVEATVLHKIKQEEYNVPQR